MTIAADHVDPELVARPRRWDVHFIRRFMLVFGLLSSVFDYVTFGVLMLLLRADAHQFRTGWFMESVISATFIVLVVRTRRPFFASPPRRYLVLSTLFVGLVTLALPYTPLGPLLGFTPLSVWFIAALFGIVALYIAAAEGVKRLFYHRSGTAA